MRICLISVEIFAWGKYGGFGRATRLIGRELVRRGHKVIAVVPRRPGQRTVEDLDGITVLGFSPWNPFAAAKLVRDADADIYHSCEPSLTSYLALRAMPYRRHIVTFRDPRNAHDWLLELARPSLNHLQVIHNYLFENNPLVRACIRRMDSVYTIGKYLEPKVQAIYGLKEPVRFLPTPVPIPTRIEKSHQPTVCYVARLDRRKRPELFIELAAKFPQVRFLLAGQSRHKSWEASLCQRAGQLNNIDMLGFVNQFESNLHSEIFAKSWVLVNTATREALPNSLLEAAAHECAILSHVDPDGFASSFGYHATTDDFERGLAWLLEHNRWRERGRAAGAYVREVFEMDRAVDLHEAAYRQLLTRRPNSVAAVPSYEH
jgi:glycosyltransferase involved in cell wall biosynthesis